MCCFLKEKKNHRIIYLLLGPEPTEWSSERFAKARKCFQHSLSTKRSENSCNVHISKTTQTCMCCGTIDKRAMFDRGQLSLTHLEVTELQSGPGGTVLQTYNCSNSPSMSSFNTNNATTIKELGLFASAQKVISVQPVKLRLFLTRLVDVLYLKVSIYNLESKPH